MGVPRGYQYPVSKSYGIDKIKDSNLKNSFVLKESNQTISRSDAYSELNTLNALNTSVIRLQNNSGKMFFQKTYDQREAVRLIKDENYEERLRVIKLIVTDVGNQKRWNLIELMEDLEVQEKARLQNLEDKNIYGYGEIWFTGQEHQIRELAIQKKLDEEKVKENVRLAKQKEINDIKIKEEKRLFDIEEKRLFVIEEKRLLDIENKRLLDIENKRLLDLSIQSQELESFYELQEIKKSEKIEPIENKEIEKTIPIPITENKEIPLETTAPILAVLGIGLVSYYLLKGNKK